MKKITLFLVFIVVVFSCNNDPRKQIDVEDVPVSELTINRLENDLFNLDTNNLKASTDKLTAKYGVFYTKFVKSILNKGGINNQDYYTNVKRFISDRDMKNAYNDCQKKYSDISFLKQELTDAFKRYNYFFPAKRTPVIITMMSGFNYLSVYMDSTLAIGLEMYLGKENKFYTMLGLPSYKTMFMNKENISVDAFRTYAFGEFNYNMNKNDFLSDIVFVGKVLYLNDIVFPEKNDTIKIQYTTKQLNYCIGNEYNIWTYFIAQKLLYTTNYSEIAKFTGEGPFTSALSKESPPRIGYWVGWQIVKHYMKNNPEVTPEQLMKEVDALKILTMSKYKPKK